MERENGPVRIALVGIGGYGELYVNQLLHLDEASGAVFVGAIEAYPERCRKLPELQAAGIPLYPDLPSFYRENSADLVVIAAPIHLHKELCCLALEHGSNVLLEKPLCVRTEDAAEMLEAERRSGKIVGIGYQWSFSDPILSLKKDILAGMFGKPILLKSLVLWPRARSYYTRNSWAGRIKTADGSWVLDSPLNNGMAHFLHNMFFLLGGSMTSSRGADTVAAELYRANKIENYDAAALQVFTADGTELHLYAAHSVHDMVDPRLHFRFEHAEVTMGQDMMLQARFDDGRVRAYGNPDAEPLGKTLAMIRSIREHTAPACGIEASFAHTECINRVQELPVRVVPPDRIRIETQGEDHLVWIADLAEEFMARFSSDHF